MHEYLEDFPGQQDVMRYVLCATAPESKDTDFTWKDFQTRNNSELVAIFGNFINRVVVLTNKYWDGVVPEINKKSQNDVEILALLEDAPKKIAELIESFKLREAQNELINLARSGNKYLADEEPWKLIKTDLKRTETIMNITLQIASALSVLAIPFLPFTAQKLSKMLNVESADWNKIPSLCKGHKIEKASLLFSKIEDDQIELQIQKLNQNK